MQEGAELSESQQEPRSLKFPLQYISAFCILGTQGNLLIALLYNYPHPDIPFLRAIFFSKARCCIEHVFLIASP